MLDIAAALSTAGQAVGLIKELNKVNQEFDKADLKLKIAELAGKIAELQLALIEAREALTEKDHDIAALRQSLQLLPELVEHDGLLYKKGNQGKPDGHPYCTRCHNVDGRLLRTVRGRNVFTSVCTQCKHEYQHASTIAWEANARFQ